MTTERLLEGAARWSPHLLVGSLCLGLAGALAAPARPLAWLTAPALAALAAVDDGGRRLALLAVALAIGGWAWGSFRLASLDRSELIRRIGDVEPALVAVTGPPRRGRFEVRAPAEVRRWGREPLHEEVLLELPPGRSPPQGALLEVLAEVRLPRVPEEPGDFDERRWLRRQGVHVVLRGQQARLVGYRGGFWGSQTVCERGWPVRWRRVSSASGTPSSKASCSARTRGCRRSSATTSAPPASTTCSPSRGKT